MVKSKVWDLGCSLNYSITSQCYSIHQHLVGVLHCNEMGCSGVSFLNVFPIFFCSAVLDEDPGNGFPGYTG